MVILSQPAVLSPAGNIKDFVISSSEVVRFRLYKGEILLLDNQYQPDASGNVTVSIKDVVLNTLSVEIPTTDNYIQQNIAADFTADISDTIVNFRAIRCGIDNYSGNISSFLSGNFLTWQPQLVETRYSQPQWLTYYNALDGDVLLNVKFYLKDGNTSVITLATIASGECISSNTQFAYIWSLLDSDKYGYYDVYVEDSSGIRLSYIQRYVLVDTTENDTVFVFENTLGGVDSVVFTGANVYTPQHTYTNAVYDELNCNLHTEQHGTYSQNSGYKTKREVLWLRDFFAMSSRYIVQEGILRPIVVDESTVSNSNMEQLHSFEFTYKLSDDTKYQNLARVDTLAAPIEITTPDNLFFLAPRLAEFERISLDGSLLLPVQSPYLEKWYTISFGELISNITDIVNNKILSFAHTHSNLSLLADLSEAEDGSLLYKGKEIGGKAASGDITNLQLQLEELLNLFELRTLANSEKVLYTKYHFVAEGELTGGGISDDLSGESGSDGVSYNRLDSWDNYNIANGDVLSAALGYSLKTDIERIQQQLDNGVLSSVTVKLGDIAYKSVNGEICLPAYPITDGLLRADVANALYTPIGYYNSIDQRVGEIEDTCITEVTSAMIISALGYTPYQSTNPNKYITSAALSDYATQVWVESKGYLTAHQDISHLLSKEIAAQTYQPKGDYLTSIPSEYITEAELNNKDYITFSEVADTYATKAAVESLRTDFDTLNTLLNDDVSGKINTWNEVVDFLNEYSGSDDLATILSGINGNITTLQGYFNNNGVAKQADKVSHALTFGNKSYNGSAALQITAADLGALGVNDTATNASKLDGVEISNMFKYYGRNADLNSFKEGNKQSTTHYINTEDTTITNAPSYYGTAVNFGGYIGNFQLFASHNNKLYFRQRWTGDWYDWHTIAFTNSNVASATKLQTARTIWGQSFDGSGNVDGTFQLNDIARDSRPFKIAWLLHNNRVAINLWSWDANGFADMCLGISSDVVSQGSLYFNASTKNWGIGKYTPAYKLDVNGTFNATAVYQNGTALGSLAFKNSLIASDIPSLNWSKITSGKPTTLGGYGITNGVSSPNGAIGTSIQEYCAANPSFMGMTYINEVWEHVISSRHRNGSGDGNLYGIYICAPNNSNLLVWEKQSNGVWLGQKTILDSDSYVNYTYGKADIDAKLSKYLPLSGGTLTGPITLDRNTYLNNVFIRYRNHSIGVEGYTHFILNIYDATDNIYGRFGLHGTTSTPLDYLFLGLNEWEGDNLRIYKDKLTFGTKTILHSGNYNTYTYPKADIDAKLSKYQPLSSAINTGNIGSQSVNYANNADAVDNYHAADFLFCNELNRKETGVALGDIGQTGAYKWNDPIYASSIFANANNALSILVSGVVDNRSAAIQVGHANIDYANYSGPLCLNPYAGNVLIGTITNDVYKLDVNGSGRFTGALYAPQISITSQNAISHLSFGRASGNYITSVSGGYIGFIPNGKSIIEANADMLISDGLIYPGTTGITSLGYGDKRWANVASVNGDFSGALTAGSFSTANVVSCGGRLRINAANSVTSFGFLKATAYSSALDRAVLDIGSNYGGSADITSEAVDVVAMSMYRGAVGVGRAFTYDELSANRNSNIMLTVAGSILTDSIKFSNGQVLSMHNDGSLHLTGNLIVDGEISTGGVSDDLGESAVSYDRLDSWDDYNASAGDVLSAVRGYGLKNDITNLANSLTSLDSRVSSLEANSGGSSTGGNYLPITGGTLSGALGISGSLTTSEDIVTNSDLTVAGNATIGIDLATTNFYASGIAEFYDMTNYYGEVYMYQDLTVDGAIYMMGDPVIASDMRYKEIVQFVSLSNDVIADAPIFKFYWEDKNDNKLHIGTSAQYWEEVDSDFISYNPRNGKLYLDYLGLTVAMGQSNAAEIRCLKLQVQKLEEVIGI